MRRLSATGLALLTALVLPAATAIPVSAQEDVRQQRLDLNKVWLFPSPPHVAPPDRIIFSHRKHIRAGEECEDCHPNAESATKAGTIGLLKEADCFECHDPDEREDCSTCHTNAVKPSARLVSRPTELIFSHAGHLKLDDVECATCHASASGSEDSADRLTPHKETCASCHQDDLDRLACRKCHTSLSDLKQSPIDEAIHKPGFFGMHGLWATGNSTLCSQCHEQSYCADCHGGGTQPMRASVAQPEAIERLFVHRGDYLGRHGIEAAAKPQSCYSCHSQNYCKDCHESNRRQKMAFADSTRLSPHPPNYVRRGGEKFHGTDARLAPQQCATCHDQGAASNCVSCHKVGGVGGNPHPPGWSRRGREQEISTSRACIPCHTMGY